MLVNERDKSLWLSTCVFYHSCGLCKENKVIDHEDWSESVLEDWGSILVRENRVVYLDKIYHIDDLCVTYGKVRWMIIWSKLPVFLARSNFEDEIYLSRGDCNDPTFEPIWIFKFK